MINDYILHFSNGSTVPHFDLNLQPYGTSRTETLEDEIKITTRQLENVTIDGHGLTPDYIKKNTFTAISSGT